MEKNLIGNKKDYAIEYSFDDKSRETEFAMYLNNRNILEFTRNGKVYTTKWILDELALWLREFLDAKSQEVFPYDVVGEYAAMKDINAREFDSDDDDEFDAYYDRLDEWNQKHRWHTESAGAILADVYFQFVEDKVEISWNNEDAEEGVDFTEKLGGSDVDAEVFINVVNEFLQEYANHWFSLQ